jgi:hypothetical protein
LEYLEFFGRKGECERGRMSEYENCCVSLKRSLVNKVIVNTETVNKNQDESIQFDIYSFCISLNLFNFDLFRT